MYTICLLSLLFGLASAVQRSATPSKSRNIFGDQWLNYISNNLREWRGLWIRSDAEGRLLAQTNSLRNWSIPVNEVARPPQNTLQINIYSSNTWNTAGETTRRFLSTNLTNPPQYVARLFDNGTVAPPFDMDVYARDNGDLLGIARRRIDASTFGCELWLVHPNISGDPIRASISPIYIAGVFSYASFVREEAGPLGYGARFWSRGTTSRRRTELPFLDMRRFWSGHEWCVDRNQDAVTRSIPVLTAALDLPSQPKERTIFLQLPGNVYMVAPKNVLDVGERDLQIMILWIVNDKAIKRGVLDFDRQGKMSKICITSYLKGAQ